MVLSERPSSDLLGYTFIQIKKIFFIYKNQILIWKNENLYVRFADFFRNTSRESFVILKIPMIASGKSHQNLSDYNQFSLKKRFEVND